MKVTAILASHNRRSYTLACLASYFQQDVEPTFELAAVLVDDGSADGTAEAVGEWFPLVKVLRGTGDLFWARAMALAESAALAGDQDYLLWLNDDVVLDKDAVQRLVETSQSKEGECIAVGALRDPDTGQLTYSGVRRRGLHPLRMDRVAPGDEPVEVETFNGNVVLVPRGVARKTGPIDGAFEHAAADFDYGLRAADAGVRNLLAPGTVGTCARGSGPRPWLDHSRTITQRLRILFGPKGLPPRSQARYLVRHGGRVWFVFWLAPYIRAAGSIVRLGRRGGETP